MKFYRLSFIVLVLILSSQTLFAQLYVTKEWDKSKMSTQQSEWTATKLDSTESVITVGSKYNLANSRYDASIESIDKFGNVEWDIIYGQSGKETFGVIVDESNSHFIKAVYLQNDISTNEQTLVISMINPNGSFSWNADYTNTAYSSFVPVGIATSSDNSTYVTVAASVNAANIDILVLKFDETGFFEWEYIYMIDQDLMTSQLKCH